MNRQDSTRSLSADPQANRRKTYVINPAFQWRYAVIIGVIVFVTTSLLSSALYLLLHQQARMRILRPDSYAAEVRIVVLFAAMAFSLVTASGIGIWSVLITHRICGPLFVLEKYLRELAHGRLPRIRKLRRRDEFQELYSVFAQAMDTMRKRKQGEFDLLTEIVHKVKETAENGRGTQKTAFQDLAGELERLRTATAVELGHDVVQIADEPVKPSRPRSKDTAEGGSARGSSRNKTRRRKPVSHGSAVVAQSGL